MIKEQVMEVIRCASKFMAKQDVRYYLNGVSLEFKHDKLLVTATDGHRLFNCTINSSHDIPIDRQYIISGADVTKILKLYDYKKDKQQELSFELVSGEFGVDDLQISDSKISYAMTPVDGKYPDYNLAIPTFGGKSARSNTHVTFGMNMTYVAEAMNALKPLGNKKYHGAQFTIGDANTSALIEVSGPEYKTLENIRAVIMPMRL